MEHSKTQRASIVAMVVMVLALLAGACTKDQTTAATSNGTGGAGAPVSQDKTVATIKAGGSPVKGGNLVFGLEAETLGWNPAVNTWAAAGHQVALALFDPLAAYDADGVAQPYLAKSFTHNEDFTSWTIGLRDGVQFHNGTPCDAAAVKKALDTFRGSPLTKSVFDTVTGIEAPDSRSVKVAMSKPWAGFPAILATQAGYVAAPAQLDAAGEDSARKPIGTGPFVLDHWTQDAELVVNRNPNYWRNGLPHLDKVTFKPIADATSRANALKVGDVDMMHTSNPESIVGLRDAALRGEIQVVNDNGEQEELSVMLNNSKAPFDDVRARRAMALATDTDRYLELIGAGITEKADGPFVKSSKWYAPHNYPGYDVAAAKKLVDEYKREKGDFAFKLGSFADAGSQQAAQLLAQMYTEAGMNVQIESVEQQALGAKAVTGDYQALSWRQFAAPDPDADYVWWHTSPGGVSLNFAKFDNPAMDAALDEARTTDDDASRKRSFAKVQEIFGDQVPFVWLAHTTWTISANNRVRGLTNGPLPDGKASAPYGGQLSGYGRLTETWIADR